VQSALAGFVMKSGFGLFFGVFGGKIHDPELWLVPAEERNSSPSSTTFVGSKSVQLDKIAD
jgi:hypothetical protein